MYSRCLKSIFLTFVVGAAVFQPGVEAAIDLYPSVEQYLPVDESFSVTCEVPGGNNPKWYDPSGREVLSLSQPGFDIRRYVERSDAEMATLWFEQIRDSDKGTYTCEFGSDTATIKIDVIEPIDFRNTPTKQHLIRGEDGFIVCNVTSYPLPLLTWKFNNFRINEDQHYDMEEGGLKVNSVTMSDKGTYTCVARIKETGDVAQKDIEVEVYELPVFQQTPESTSAVEGRSSQFFCKASGIPAPTITWQFHGAAVTPNEKYSIAMAGNGSSVLNINNVQSADGGDYNCKASTPIANINASATLIIHTIPEIGAAENKTAKEGDKVSFKCTVTKGNPKPTLTWTRNGQIMQSGVQPSDSRIEVSSDDDDLVISIDDVRGGDIGAYTCVAESFAGRTTKDFFLNVEHSPYIDTSKTPSVVKSWLGHPTPLKCVVKSNPAPTMHWEFAFERANNSLQKTLEVNTYQSTLMIIPSAETNFGDYKCVAENDRGKIEHTMILEEIYAPSAPYQIHVRDTTQTSVTLEVEEPDNLGKSPIERCKVVFNEGTSGPQVREEFIDGTRLQTDITFDGLNGGTEYTVTAACANKVGYGPPLSPSVLFATDDYSAPDAPRIVSKANSMSADSYVLMWEIQDDGGSPISHYELTYTDNTVGDTSTAKIISDISSAVTQYTLKNLKPSTSYKLELKAYNQQGAGDAATIDITTAKGSGGDDPGYLNTAESTKSAFALLLTCIALFFQLSMT